MVGVRDESCHLDLNKQWESTCKSINCKDLLQHKWAHNLSRNSFLAHEDRMCELLTVMCCQQYG